MKAITYIFIFINLENSYLFSQNLILNPSFNEVNKKENIYLPFQILKGNKSQVKNWYIPTYINKDSKRHENKDNIYYFSSKDKELIPKNRAFTKHWNTNTEQFFENNLGFLRLQIIDFKYSYELTLVQQKLNKIPKKGYYCFRFKYKTICPARKASISSIEFSFSKTDLKEFCVRNTFNIPDSMIQISFKDTTNTFHKDDNTPWLQSCHKLFLNGDERFLSFGGLVKKEEPSYYNTFYIDDIELFYDTLLCECEINSRDIPLSFNRDFMLNKIYESDSLAAFRSININTGNGLLSPDTKYYLNNIISFMTKNPKTNIKFIEHNSSHVPVYYCNTYINYLKFYKIQSERITAENVDCQDSSGFFCKPNSEYIKINFILQ